MATDSILHRVDTSVKSRRLSVFTERGLDSVVSTDGPTPQGRPRRHVRFQSKSDVYEHSENEEPPPPSVKDLASPRTPRQPNYKVSLKTPPLPSPPRSSLPFTRYFPFALIIAVILALLHHSPFINNIGRSPFGVAGVVIPVRVDAEPVEGRQLDSRQDTTTNYCVRWSHQSALVNGTIYLYGGHASTTYGQTNGTWNNDFSTLDLGKTWQISTPTLKALPRPSGPPPVSNGYLWNSYNSLFLYGGEFSDSPITTPEPYAMWEYNIGSSSWTERSSPRTLPRANSDGGNQPVQNAAEGAGVSVPELGRGWYFGGHLDPYTTPGWPQSIFRVYLNSLIEYTFPGSTNDAIDTLKGGQPAGNDGAWRNITSGGDQGEAGFTDRADGVVIYVPGFGAQGIILALAGGTNVSFTQMNIIDVFDIETSKWYKQTTSGTPPSLRVNPCAVAASAEDGSSTNIYMFGGQNLLPYKGQVQYNDMWILTVPSFTWIQVDTNGQSVPYARAGHTCNVWNGQMIVVGGYIGTNLTCETPGIYVFDASELKWQNQFTALSGANAQNQQGPQAENKTGLSGSYGYQVPGAVQSIIGGNGNGGATVTAPVMTATSGPLATGKPIIYTITASGGATVTETASPHPNGNGGTTSSSDQQNSGTNVAAIAAGVVAGVFFIIACYLGFCAWVYRRQLQLYKNHVATSQRAAVAGPNEKSAFLAARTSEDPSGKVRRSGDRNSGPSGSGITGRSGGNSGIHSPLPIPAVAPVGGNSTANSSTEDLMTGQEPSFIGVLLNPRRSLRVVNRD